METATSLRLRSLWILALAAVTLSLAACSSTQSLEEIEDAPEQIVETSDFLSPTSSWSYLEPGEKELPLSEACPSEPGEGCWESEDSSVSFAVEKPLRGSEIYRLTVRGVSSVMSCATDYSNGSRLACAPALPEKARP